MTQQSAGLLPFKYVDGALYVMLVHPGGPFWAGKDEGVWSIPKGLVEEARIKIQRGQAGFIDALIAKM